MSEPYRPVTMAMVAAGLQAFAKGDIRNAPASTWAYEPFRCHRCNDLGWVTDWAGHRVTWLWQRSEPYARIPCPDCGGEAK